MSLASMICLFLRKYEVVYVALICMIWLSMNDSKEMNNHSRSSKKGQIYDITATNFIDIIYRNQTRIRQLKADNFLFIDFTAPWCGHCSSLHQELDLLSHDIEAQQLPVSILRVDMSIDSTDTSYVIKEAGITGYPTLLLYHDHHHVASYNGSRTSKNMMNFLSIKTKAHDQHIINRITRLDDISKIVLHLNYNGLNKVPKHHQPSSSNHHDDSQSDYDISYNHILLQHDNQHIIDHITDLYASDIMAMVLFIFPLAASGSGRGIHGPLMQLAYQLQYDCPWLIIRYSDSTSLVEYFGIIDDSIIIFNAIDNYQYQETYHLSKHSFPSHTIIPIINIIEDHPYDSINQHLSYLKDTIFKFMFPMIMYYDAHIQSLLRLLPITSHVLIFHDPKRGNTGSESHDEHIYHHIEAMARLYRGQMLFIYVDINTAYHLTQAFHITKQDTALPSIIIIDMLDPYNIIKYRFNDYEIPIDDDHHHDHDVDIDGDVNMKHDNEQQQRFVRTLCDAVGHDDPDCIAAKSNYHTTSSSYDTSRPADINHEHDLLLFFQQYHQHILPQSLDSEQVEDLDNMNRQLGYGTSSHVETIGAVNFYQKVLEDGASDVLVYFFAPWCAYCKAIEPIIEDVTMHYLHAYDDKDMKMVQVYRINGIENEVDIDAIQIKVFPVLYFFAGSSNKMEPVEYVGDRTAASIIAFIDSHHSNLNLHV